MQDHDTDPPIGQLNTGNPAQEASASTHSPSGTRLSLRPRSASDRKLHPNIREQLLKQCQCCLACPWKSHEVLQCNSHSLNRPRTSSVQVLPPQGIEFEVNLEAKHEELVAKHAELLAKLTAKDEVVEAKLAAKDEVVKAKLAAKDEVLAARLAAKDQELVAKLAAKDEELAAKLAAKDKELKAKLVTKDKELAATLVAKDEELAAKCRELVAKEKEHADSVSAITKAHELDKVELKYQKYKVEQHLQTIKKKTAENKAKVDDNKAKKEELKKAQLEIEEQTAEIEALIETKEEHNARLAAVTNEFTAYKLSAKHRAEHIETMYDILWRMDFNEKGIRTLANHLKKARTRGLMESKYASQSYTDTDLARASEEGFLMGYLRYATDFDAFKANHGRLRQQHPAGSSQARIT